MIVKERRVDLRSAFAGGVVAALLVIAAPAIADVGEAVLAGRFNVTDAKTTLSGDVAADSTLKVANASSDGSGITIQVATGNAPLVVNSGKRVKRLNADKLDGYDAAAFALRGETGLFAAGQIRADGTIRSATANVIGVTTPITGAYCIAFANATTPDRLEMAVVGQAGADEIAAFPKATNGESANASCPAGTLQVEINDAAGTLIEARFSFVVP